MFLEFNSLLSTESIYFFRRTPKHTETLLFRASVQFIRVGTVRTINTTPGESTTLNWTGMGLRRIKGITRVFQPRALR